MWGLVASIGIGGALGALTRFQIKDWSLAKFGDEVYWGTLIANMVGCFIAGFLLTFWQESNISINLKQGVMIGFLGALTTFSTFSIEALLLFQHQQYQKALLYIASNLLICLFMVFVGAWLGGRIAS
ncbi:fluoride efflux transporter CrcB [Kangiella sp. TOML190]|uniref:fluoride efflux transporter CrcB n=1 Tax=Kangiella sp. TOML190 TaxID=2931351 RepID=UPI00203FA04A|nr:fluoride efflux transporter CrcB [Kangiella sp. TOML190]